MVEISFIISKTGRKLLKLDNFLYRSLRPRKHLSYWSCINRSCKVRVCLKYGALHNIKWSHNHPPDTEMVTAEELFLNKLEKRVARYLNTPVPKIYRDEMATLPVAVRNYMPKYNNVKKRLYDARRLRRELRNLEAEEEGSTEEQQDYIDLDSEGEEVIGNALLILEPKVGSTEKQQKHVGHDNDEEDIERGLPNLEPEKVGFTEVQVHVANDHEGNKDSSLPSDMMEIQDILEIIEHESISSMLTGKKNEHSASSGEKGSSINNDKNSSNFEGEDPIEKTPQKQESAKVPYMAESQDTAESFKSESDCESIASIIEVNNLDEHSDADSTTCQKLSEQNKSTNQNIPPNYKISFIESNRGARNLILGNYTYYCQSTNDRQGRSYWKCVSFSSCKGRLILENGTLFKAQEKHNHQPDRRALFLKRLEEKAVKDLTTPLIQLYEEEISTVTKSVAHLMPRYENIKGILHATRLLAEGSLNSQPKDESSPQQPGKPNGNGENKQSVSDMVENVDMLIDDITDAGSTRLQNNFKEISASPNKEKCSENVISDHTEFKSKSPTSADSPPQSEEKVVMDMFTKNEIDEYGQHVAAELMDLDDFTRVVAKTTINSVLSALKGPDISNLRKCNICFNNIRKPVG